jgi:hypothetical protein
MKKSHLKSQMSTSTAIPSTSKSTSTRISIPTVPTSATTIADTSTLSENIVNIKIENATAGLPPYCLNRLCNRVLPASRGKENALTIYDYISSLRSEINPSDHYKKDIIILLCNLSTFFKNAKFFKEITREDLLSFLDSYRKAESVDPLHKWI